LEYRPTPNHEFFVSLSRNEFNDDEILQATELALSNGFQGFAGPRVLNEEVALALGYDLDEPEIQDRLNSPVIVNKALRFDEAVALGVLEFNQETRNYTHTQLSGDGLKFWESQLVTDEILTYQFGGKSAFGDALNIDYKFYSSEANKEVAEQRIRMDANGAAFDVRLLEGTFRPVIVEIGEKKLDRASTFGLTDDRGFLEDNTSFSDDLRNGIKVNANWSKQWLSAEATTSFGLAMDFRDKGFQNNLKRFSQIDSADSNRISLENDVLNGGDLEPILTDFGDEYIFGPAFDSESARGFINDPGDFVFDQSPDDLTATVTDRILSNFQATEDVTAAYFMEKVRFGKWTLIAGLRYEETENTYTVNTINTFDENDRFIQPNRWRFFDEDVFLREETFSRSYDNWLPAFHVRYDWTEDVVIRASATQTIARPEFTKVIPSEIIGVSAASFSRSLRLPNFELMPMESTNLDLSVEHFSKRLGLASVAFFYKKLDGPIYDESRILGPSDPISQALSEKYTARGTSADEWKTRRFANAGDGSLLGVEFTLNKRLTFLPEPFDSFGFTFNTSLIESSVELLLEERLNEEVPLFKQASNLGNFSVYFERWGLDVRLSYFWRSEFLRNVSAGRELIGELQNEDKLDLTADALDIYEGAFQRVDLLVQYTWKGFTFFFEGTNLGNEPKLYYDGNQSRLNLVQYTQPIYFGGMKFNF
jgi:TonB-dependent receptor